MAIRHAPRRELATFRCALLMALKRTGLDRVFSIHHERVVNKDTTVRWDNLLLQIESTRLRSTMADLNVIIYQHLDGTLSVGYGPYTVGRYGADGQLLASTPPRRPTKRKPKKNPGRKKSKSMVLC